ncbi:MAG: hypothetical protein M3Z05_11160 [Gemmatimonadota bacterium]|nr:hypothetical protein [Gemmatimonadota bacterium]
MADINFPAALHADLKSVLEADAASRGASAEDAEFIAAMDAVCRYALTSGMSPEGMVIALRHAYDAAAVGDARGDTYLRGAYDRLLSGCIEAYFADQQTVGTSSDTSESSPSVA